MTLDLTQPNKPDISSNKTPIALRLKQKVADRESKTKIPDRILKSRERRKQNAMATNLTANVDYTPTTDRIFISKIDYHLESEMDDGYLFRKIRQEEVQKAELAGVFAKRKLIVGNIREKMKQNREG